MLPLCAGLLRIEHYGLLLFNIKNSRPRILGKDKEFSVYSRKLTKCEEKSEEFKLKEPKLDRTEPLLT